MRRGTQSRLSLVGSLTIPRLVCGLALAALLFAPIREVSAVELNVLAAGAVESVVRDMVGTFEKESGHTVKLAYAPVGALRDKIFAGEPADLTIVTPVIIEQLQAKGLVRPTTRTDLGRVGGGIAVRKGAPRPAIGTPEELKQALLAAKEIYSCRPEDRHGRRLLPAGGGPSGHRGGGAQEGPHGRRRQGVDGADGEIDRDAIGVTQISEILSVPSSGPGRPVSRGPADHDDVHGDRARAHPDIRTPPRRSCDF